MRERRAGRYSKLQNPLQFRVGCDARTVTAALRAQYHHRDVMKM